MHASHVILLLALVVVWAAPVWAAPELEPIDTVEIGANNELLVNGKPFIPLMSWAQDTSRFPLLKSLGFNAFAGNHGGKPPAREYCDIARAAGGYALPNFDAAAKGHPALVGYLQPDEPDMGFAKGRPRMTAEEVLAAYKDMNGRTPRGLSGWVRRPTSWWGRRGLPRAAPRRSAPTTRKPSKAAT